MWATYGLGLLSTGGSSNVSISNPAIASASMTQDDTNTITYTVTNAARAIVVFLDSSSDIVKVIEATISGTTATASIVPADLPVDTYSAGHIELYAINAAGTDSALDDSLSLTVTAGTSSYEYQVAVALRTVLRADARLTDIHNNDILIIGDEDEIIGLPQYPSIGIIADEDMPEFHDVNQRRHKVTVWALVANSYAEQKLDNSDFTQPKTVHDYARAVLDAVEEQDQDPDKRLGKLTQTLHATDSGTRYIKKNKLYVKFIKIDATVIAK